MRYLTAAQVLFIHARLIAETGGEGGIRDLGLLQVAIARPKATFEGNDLYPDLFQKAGSLMESLINNHPFLDGNKRTGITSTAMILQNNGGILTASNEKLEHFTISLASGKQSIDGIAAWLKQNSNF
ncbi:MAG: type II toxin-antitoxin system death-on-curing family toxin [Anaerolineae bacterium]|nr:type II toxin-antitoxin system death-on-curing family toxin [Anaerolineae bacterium]